MLIINIWDKASFFKKMERTAAIAINSLIKQMIGQNRKHHNILQFSVWVVQYLLFSAQFECAMHQHLVNLHILHVQFVQKKNKKYCKSNVYMKYHPNDSLKNIMVFSTLARNMKTNSNIVELCSTLN